MNDKKLVIGLFGFGVVGEGIYQVLNDTPSLNATIKKICIRHPEKKRNADPALFTTDADLLLNDPEINLIVELINDAAEAARIVRSALRGGKSVVSANKAMIAEHLPELLQLQNERDVSLLYEAAVCGSIPILRNLEEYYDNDLLKGFCGIVNGSTNFILTKIIDEGLSFDEALLLAQQSGFAESDPTLDVEGTDAANKLAILLLHTHGYLTGREAILHRGITQIHTDDAKFAAEKGYRIKLCAQARKLGDGKLAVFVLPQFVTPESQLFNVNLEYNGVVIESKLADKQFLYGKGAGRFPTSSAVLSDIAALRYGYKYEYRKMRSGNPPAIGTDHYFRVYVSCNNWAEINKWDFEWIEASHSTHCRQYLVGIISHRKLSEADWSGYPGVSLILMPTAIIERSELLKKAMQKMSLQLAGVS